MSAAQKQYLMLSTGKIFLQRLLAAPPPPPPPHSYSLTLLATLCCRLFVAAGELESWVRLLLLVFKIS